MVSAAFCSSALKVRERSCYTVEKDKSHYHRNWVVFFNSWVFLFILCSPLYWYLEPRCFQELDLGHLCPLLPPSCKQTASTNQSLHSNIPADFCCRFLPARAPVPGGGGCWSLWGCPVVRGVPEGLICRPTTSREVERFRRAEFGSCGGLPCLDTNPPDTVPEHKTQCAVRTSHWSRGKEGKGRQQGSSKTKVSPLSLVLGITGIYMLFNIPETWFQDYSSGMCRTFLKLTSSNRHQYLISLHRLKTVPNKAIKPQKHWMI